MCAYNLGLASTRGGHHRQSAASGAPVNGLLSKHYGGELANRRPAPNVFPQVFDQLIGGAGVRRIRSYDLRHTCTSLLLAQDVPRRVVIDVLGDPQLAITPDLYSHVVPSALREAADAIDRVLEAGE